MILLKKTSTLFFFIFLFAFVETSFSQKKNVLFIAIDDLKPNLGCYGDDVAISPNIDKLADAGTVFANNHCQRAVCGPSRASLLTGLRPDRTKVWDLKTLIRDVDSDALMLPQYFRENGYTTAAFGKIFDPRSVDKKHDEVSWSVPYVKYTKGKWVESSDKPIVEAPDQPVENFVDAEIAGNSIAQLQKFAQSSEPFFLAVGFKKPHLPFVAPKSRWDLYERDNFVIHPFQEQAENSPSYVYHTGNELRKNYTGMPLTGNFSVELQKELLHGYYACISHVDLLVKKIIDELDTLGLRDNTTIVLWGDHGWHLGDHAIWGKHTNFEQATRSPLIIVDPDYEGGKISNTPTEFIDIFPTLCKLAGLEVPSHLQGKSLTPILRNENVAVKDFAVTQYKRSGKVGYTIRTNRYRYTEWMDLEYREGTLPYNESIVSDNELYDYQTDPMEQVSLIYDSNYQTVLDSMKIFLSDFLIHQFDTVTSVNSKKKDKFIVENFDITNYPNPFNPSTNISFTLNKATNAKVVIYNTQGKEIVTLANDNYKSGIHNLTWSGVDRNNSEVASGVYFAKLETSSSPKITKLMLLR